MKVLYNQPVSTAKNTSKANSPATHLSVPRLNVLTSDTVSFRGRADEAVLKNLYNHICSKIVEPNETAVQKLFRMTFDIPKEVTEKIIAKLTKYSNYECIERLKNEFRSHNINEFYDFKEFLYDEGASSACGLLNKPLNRLNLNNVFSYLMKKDKNKLSKGTKGLILDDSSLKFLSEIKEKNPQKFEQIIAQTKPVYIKDFESSYNVFNQSAAFEHFAMPTADGIGFKLSEMPSEIQNIMLDEHFSANVLQRAKKLGIEPLTIDIAEPANLNESLKNMSVPKPSLEEFKNEITRITEGFDSEHKSFLYDFLAEDFHYYSPQSLGRKLKELEGEIIKKVKLQNRPIENIFYTVPNTDSSFGIMNYMYKMANNIPDEKFIYWNGNFSTSEMLRNLPKNSTIAVIDDAAISGASLFGRSTGNNFGYNINWLEKERPDINIVFAPILDTEMSRGLFKFLINDNTFNHQCRAMKDSLAAVDHSKLVEGAGMSESNPLLKILHPSTERVEFNTAIIFPHCAPDNNAPRLRELFKKFFENPVYVKEPYKLSEYLDINGTQGNIFMALVNKGFYKK